MNNTTEVTHATEDNLEELKVIEFTDIAGFSVVQSAEDSMLYNVVAIDKDGEYLMMAVYNVTEHEAEELKQRLERGFDPWKT